MVTEKSKQYHREYSRIRRQKEWLLKNVTHDTLRKMLIDLGARSTEARGKTAELIQKIIERLELMK